MVVQYDSENDEYFIKERIGNQTVKLVFQMHNWNEDTIFFNVSSDGFPPSFHFPTVPFAIPHFFSNADTDKPFSLQYFIILL